MLSVMSSAFWESSRGRKWDSVSSFSLWTSLYVGASFEGDRLRPTLRPPTCRKEEEGQVNEGDRIMVRMSGSELRMINSIDCGPIVGFRQLLKIFHVTVEVESC